MAVAVNRVGKISTPEGNDQVVATYSFEWTISEFSKLTSKFESPSFFAGVNDLVEWNLEAYPNGIDKDSEGYLSLFLNLVSSYECIVLAKFKFSIVNTKKVKVNQLEVITAHKFYIGESNFGWHKFKARDFILNKSNALLTDDDQLTIACDITVYGNNENKAFKLRTPDYLQQILGAQKFSDVTLVIGKKKFQAHKEILAARSPVFAAMFNHDMAESKQNQVKITDIKANVLEEMLNFIYTDKAPKIKEVAEDLLAAADKYQLERLKLMCESVLSLNLTIKNVSKIVVLADLHNGAQLKTKAIEFICMNEKDVGQTEEFKMMTTSYPTLFVEVWQIFADKNQPN